jgi:hypothetical protein
VQYPVFFHPSTLRSAASAASPDLFAIMIQEEKV